ncbi:MAG: S8 family serine peptidase [Candidatus Sungbacteria bacterium]|nr:S8 family serine peptidase [Candidatus Sungbacteria bacterium]
MNAHFIKKTLFNVGVLVLSLISGFVITFLSVWVPLDGPQIGTINCGFPSGLPFSFRGTWKYLSGPPHPLCALAFDSIAWMADIIFWAGVIYLISVLLKKAAKHFRIILNEGRIIAILIIFILVLLVVLIRNTNAQSAGRFDLKNLRDQNPLLTKAYDIIRLQEAWEKIIQSNFTSFVAVIIGIMDTGVDPDHQEFNGPQVNLGSFTRSVLFDFDPGGHGTQIAGIIGANNVLGTATLPLNSPQMNGILSGVLNENNYVLEIRQIGGQIQISAFAAIESVIRRNAQSVNMSFGGALCDALSIFSDRGCYKTAVEFTDAFSSYKRLFQQASSTIFVAGAGNDNFDASQSLPGALSLLSNVITVGATDLDDKRAVFVSPEKSNFGSVVNISAPGKNVYAPKPGGDYDKPDVINGEAVGGFSGTSASAPMVTGVAGLIKAIKPSLSPAEIKQILTESADPITASTTDEIDKKLGSACNDGRPGFRGCRLNAEKAVCHALVGLDCVPPPPLEEGFIVFVFPKIGIPTKLIRITADGTKTDIFDFGKRISGDGVVVDSNGDFIVLATNELLRITAEGVATRIFGDNIPVGTRCGLAIDFNGNFIVVANSVLSRITPEGIQTEIFRFPPETEPRGIAVALNGDFIVAEAFPDDRLVRITPSGILSEIVSFKPENNPTGVSIDANGDFIVAIQSQSKLYRVSPDGMRTEILHFGLFPECVVIDRNGDFIITEFGTNILSRITRQGVRIPLVKFDPQQLGFGVTIAP